MVQTLISAETDHTIKLLQVEILVYQSEQALSSKDEQNRCAK